MVNIVDVYYNIFYLPYLCLVAIYSCIILYYKFIHPMCILGTKEINRLQFFSIFNMDYTKTHLRHKPKKSKIKPILEEFISNEILA